MPRKNIRIGIIDYAASNLRSVQKAFTHIGAEDIVSSNALELNKADALIFPDKVPTILQCKLYQEHL